ncbi:MAG: hypothetical protein KDH17_01790 [Rhodocyclaceae bacterium]|nr:hypothetical protein [Rhodocyclaceae bacterium]
MNDILVSEWKEARHTIARFDGYLLKLRILAASAFSIFLVAAAGVLKLDPTNGHLEELVLVALGLLAFYISVVFVLDRYYERMLMIAVNRASRLEAVRLRGFKIGLTTEIEDGKRGRATRSSFKEALEKYLSSSSEMVTGVYQFVYLAICAGYVFVLFRASFDLASGKGVAYLLAIVFLVILGERLHDFSKKVMLKPLADARRRARVAQSPEILTQSDIESCIKRMSAEIIDWLEQENAKSLTVICVLNGARKVCDALVGELERNNISCGVFFIKATATHAQRQAKEFSIDYGNISGPSGNRSLALIVDDLVDSGRTLEMLTKYVQERGYGTVKSAALLRKYSEVGRADFIGFDLQLSRDEMARKGIDDYWLFGYGMDYDDYYRHLDYIGWLEIRSDESDGN